MIFEQLTIFDLSLLSIAIISSLYGAFRGFFSEVLSLLVWVFAFFATFNLDSIFYPLVFAFIKTEVLRLWILRLVILILALVIGSLMKKALMKIVKTNFPGNMFFGLTFGLLRAFVFVAFVMALIQDTFLYEESWVQGSVFLESAENILNFFKNIIIRNL